MEKFARNFKNDNRFAKRDRKCLACDAECIEEQDHVTLHCASDTVI